MAKQKKNEFVTTLGFDEKDSEHRYVARRLNEMGRSKAKYVTKAVLFYENYKDTVSDTEPAGTVDYERIREYIRQTVAEYAEQGKGIQKKDREQYLSEPVRETEPESSFEENVFEEDAMNDILASLQSFRKG